jgi:hypothetical protein
VRKRVINGFIGIEKRVRRDCGIVLDARTPVPIEPLPAKNKMFWRCDMLTRLGVDGRSRGG